MNIKRKSRLDGRAKIMKALAHPARLLIVEELAGGERCVCEFVDMIGGDFSTVSKHLSVLKKAGLVTDRKSGLQVYYSLRCPCILNFFDCLTAVIAEQKG
ncbi:MAG: ArsR/SmtB family transcription factor [Kiritimatiellia bacterium]